MGEWIYGCDICQEVCPWNSKAIEALDPLLRPRFASGKVDVEEVLEWDQEQYAQKLRRSAMKRVKLPQLKRNATIVRNNLQEE
jgi:epoxyqueuosine reductase